MWRSLLLRRTRSKSKILLSNPLDMDILPRNMNIQFAHMHHHAHPKSLEDRAMSVCIPV
jgi:hypothetical protein